MTNCRIFAELKRPWLRRLEALFPPDTSNAKMLTVAVKDYIQREEKWKNAPTTK